VSSEKTPPPETSNSASISYGETLTLPACPACGLKMEHGAIKCPNDGTEIVSKFKVGDRLSEKYEFLESVGSGGMGIIYKAKHLALNRIVAIKLLHPYLLNSNTILRFQREARTASKLRHPNLIEVQDVGTTDDGQPFMVMDFVSGQSLSDAIRKQGRLSVEETLKIFVQLCSGLDYAHRQSILHRDLKPSNVMLVEVEGGDIIAKILDFGIAKVLEEEDRQNLTLTKTGEVFGSPLYMSPEQGAGGKVDQRSDAYSLGCMFFECLTGTTPFVGKSIIETLMQHAQEKPPTLKEATLGLDFPDELNRMVDKLLRKVPSERYQSILEFKEDIQQMQVSLQQQAPDAESILSKRDLRQLAGGDATENSGKQKSVFSSIGGKDIAIVLLSIAVIVLLGKDVWLSYKASQGVELGNSAKFQMDVPAADYNDQLRRKVAKDVTAERFEYFGGDATDAQLKSLAWLTRVQVLGLDGNLIGGTGLDVAKGLRYLQKLSVSGNPLTDKGVETISKLRQLDNLEVKQVRLSDTALAFLGMMKNLKKLEMDGCEIDPKSIKYLSGMPNLHTLGISDIKRLSDRNICQLKDLPKLASIDVSRSKTAGEAFDDPSQFPALKEVALQENILSEKGFKSMSKLKTLEYLDLRDAQYEIAWLRWFKSTPNFKLVKVSRNVDVAKLKAFLPRQCKVDVD